MIEIKAPDSYAAYTDKKSVFLAGSIDMGNAVDWQAQVCDMLADKDVLILNPRRDEWDSSWEQSIDNPKFCEQVEWELQALDDADIIFYYFAPNSKAPITFLEFGLYAAKHPEKCIVCCPDGFWRKGNIDIVCKRYGVRQLNDLTALQI